MHRDRYRRWAKDQPAEAATIERWMRLEHEIPLGGANAPTYAELAATPFILLSEPVRSEFLYVVQQRDLARTAMLEAVDLRSFYLHLRKSEIPTLVGMDMLGYPAKHANIKGMAREYQARIDGAYRSWSGHREATGDKLYMSDIELRRSGRRQGLRATMDLSGIETPWIYDTVVAWTRAMPRGPKTLPIIATAWTIADEVVRARGVYATSLTRPDMDAIHRSILQRFEKRSYQGRHLAAIRDVSEYARSNPDELAIWQSIPPSFSVDSVRHQPNGESNNAASNVDEPFRFVPQPIIDWVMDHMPLYSRRTAYKTAEARVMIFLQERCGRRTSETVALKDDCISYDSAGDPYLEWRQGKPPYSAGKRLPIHQETHDVIREWQAIKRTHGIHSGWLFPATGRRGEANHVGGGFLVARVNELIEVVVSKAPFTAAVEGAEGNLIHFDLPTIDPYSFRHAFAQRYADATDEHGRPATDAEALQEFMGHANYNSTMAYFQVTSKRRKRALAAISPRRLDMTGTAVAIDRERDAFGKLAVSLGTCSEPVNVLSGGDACAIDHACESCPFFLVDPLERDGMVAKRVHLKSQFERFRLIAPQSHMVTHLGNRIDDCTRIISGIDRHIASLPEEEQIAINTALERMEDVRRRATAPRTIDLRALLRVDSNA